MIKLALVGKDISHSRSPEIYQKWLGPSLQYDLLDFKKSSDIPSAFELMSHYDGLSITSPYKKCFLDQVLLEPFTKTLGAINCLYKREQNIYGVNTDELALTQLLALDHSHHSNLAVIVLGSGVMAQVTAEVLRKLAIPFVLLSRQNHGALEGLNLQEQFAQFFSFPHTPMVINTCSREFVFNGKLPKDTLFWDYNYDFLGHRHWRVALGAQYRDGLSLLLAQGQKALAFWFPERFSK